MRFFLVLTLCVYSVYADISDLEPLTDEMINAINAYKTTWKAGKNFNGSSSLQMDELFSTESNRNYWRNFTREEHHPYALPKHFDAREAWPNCTSIGKIYDQTKGYPSWIYTAVGAIADRLCIKFGVQIDVEATVERLTKCSGYSKEHNSANIGQAIEYWSNNGFFTVESEDDSQGCLPFSKKCQTNEIKVNGHFKATSWYNPYMSNLSKDIMLNGPMPMTIQVFSDFLNYKSGIYESISKRSLGFHNVKFIGWGIENGVKYLLGTNSWGSDWGENGTFKIVAASGMYGNVPGTISISLESADTMQGVPVPEKLFYLVK